MACTPKPMRREQKRTAALMRRLYKAGMRMISERRGNIVTVRFVFPHETD